MRKIVRYTLVLSINDLNVLGQLKKQLGLSKAAAFRESIRFYAAILERLGPGDKLKICGEDGSECEIVITAALFSNTEPSESKPRAKRTRKPKGQENIIKDTVL